MRRTLAQRHQLALDLGGLEALVGQDLVDTLRRHELDLDGELVELVLLILVLGPFAPGQHPGRVAARALDEVHDAERTRVAGDVHGRGPARITRVTVCAWFLN
jgi:hypothetical protein